MNEEKISSLKRLGRMLLQIVLVVFAATAVCFIALTIYANKKEKESLALWEKAGYSLEKRYQDLADTKENDCAKEIKALANKMGVISIGDSPSKRVDYTKVRDYIWDQLQKDRYEFIKPDKEVVDKLNEINGDILRLREILDKNLPIWGFERKDLGYDSAAHTSLLGLERLLCAESLYALSEKRPEEAIKNLNTAMKLAVSFREKGTLIDSIIYLVSFKMITGTARFMLSPPDEFVQEISALAPRDIMREGFANEAAMMRVITDKTLDSSVKLEGVHFYNIVLYKPYMKLCGAGYDEYFLDFIKQLEAANPCELSDIDINSKVINKMPKWNVIAQVAMPNLQDSWTRACRITLERDLTLIILKVRAEKAKTGQLPDSVELPKSVCPKTAWKYMKNGDHFSIYFDGEFKTNSKDPKKGLPLPLKWEE
jgi:hypothetical protein